MLDFSDITSPITADEAVQAGRLAKTFLLPRELGGDNRPENLAYIPTEFVEEKINITAELISAARKGMIDVAIIPEYRGTSFVPTKIAITAAVPGMIPGYKFELLLW